MYNIRIIRTVNARYGKTTPPHKHCGLVSPPRALLEHKDARGNVSDEPFDAVDEAGASDGRARLDVAVPIQHELVESEHGRDVGQREGAREILLVGKDEQRRAGELLTSGFVRWGTILIAVQRWL